MILHGFEMRVKFRALALFVFVLSSSTSATAQTAYSYRIVRAYPHDQQAFTQGLIYVDGHLYESTGMKGRSSLREEDLETGRILQLHAVPDQYFAEGLTDWKNTLVQLTWQSHLALVYDRATFRLLRTFSYPGKAGGSRKTAKTLSSAMVRRRFVSSIPTHSTRFAALR